LLLIDTTLEAVVLMVLASTLLLMALAWLRFCSLVIHSFSNMVAQVLDKRKVDIPPDSPEIFSINQADVNELTHSFYDFLRDRASKEAANKAAISGAALAIGGAVLTAGSVHAAPPGGGNGADQAAQTIAAGVANAIAMIRAIDGIGLAAFGVALAPMGFMVTLRVLNMVLSRV
jgi:hypothetical protein